MISQRMIEGAERYAAADKSDPFTLARCHAHMRSHLAPNGTLVSIAAHHRGEDSKEYSLSSGVDAFYDAKEYTEQRTTADGKEYPVTVYRNIVRP